jgi:hypothetical protein
MSSAYKKALEKKKTAKVSMFEEDRQDSSSSASEQDASDQDSVKDEVKAAEDDENQLRAFRD